MEKISTGRFVICALLFLSLGCGLCAAEIELNKLPPTASVMVDFDRDIRPIFETSCNRCHGPEKPRSRFRLDNRESALKGGNENPDDIVPGDSARSILIHYVAREVPDMAMPPDNGNDPLTAAQISLLRMWIDQGAKWGATNQPLELAFTFAPALRWEKVAGDQSKFRELEGIKPGFSGGIEDFSFTQQMQPDEKFSADGHFIIPDQDFELNLALDESDRGFVRGGFETWRKYYDDTGGYNSTTTPPEFDLNRDLFVNIGRFWIDLGLALPRWPQFVLGYEYQFKTGDKSMLDWGNANGKNIYPATQGVDEQTHIIKLAVTHDLNDWRLEDKARVELYTGKNQGTEPQILFGSARPDMFINTQDNYHHVQGMNTLTLEKQVRNWWFLSGGHYYSRLEGSDLFNQTTLIPAFGFATTLASQQVTLRRDSDIFSLASLFTPLDYLSLSLGTQNEWTRESGFGNSIPDLELGGNVPVNSSSDKFKTMQDANLRFTKIPFTVLFAETRFEQESIGQFQQENPAVFLRQTDASNHRYDFQSGFNTSP